jgi:hypothetical protein
MLVLIGTRGQFSVVVLNWIFFPTGFQEAHKLLQPADKTLKTMAIEFAEFQVNFNFFSIDCNKDSDNKFCQLTLVTGYSSEWAYFIWANCYYHDISRFVLMYLLLPRRMWTLLLSLLSQEQLEDRYQWISGPWLGLVC